MSFPPAGPRLKAAAAVVLLLALGCVPAFSRLSGDAFYVSLFTRVLVFSIAATGLNLVLGYGGMVSFGHSLYVGIGVYAVGILSTHGITNGWAQVLTAVGAGGAIAVLVGLVCLRVTGMAFIMITLAFAQMFYFLLLSIKVYGGDEGISLASRSDFWPLDIARATTFYYLCLAALLVVLFLCSRLVSSRFGTVLIGSRINNARMASLGFPTLRYRLAAYAMSAMICAVGGVLLANLTQFVSPSYVQWALSGELIVMVMLGGRSTLLGPLCGAGALVLLEEALTSVSIPALPNVETMLTTHWKIVLGALIVSMSLYWARRDDTGSPAEGTP